MQYACHSPPLPPPCYPVSLALTLTAPLSDRCAGGARWRGAAGRRGVGAAPRVRLRIKQRHRQRQGPTSERCAEGGAPAMLHFKLHTQVTCQS